MLDSGSTHVRSLTERGGAVPIVRRITLGMTVALLVQYALGMVVNLDVTVPARDQGGGVFVAIGRAFANGPAGLAIHAGPRPAAHRRRDHQPGRPVGPCPGTARSSGCRR